MSNIQTIIDLGAELERQKNAAFDLWSWLPSHKVAVRWHGDHASNFTPSVHDVLMEACIVFSKERGFGLSKEDREFLTQCPCGEDHEEEERNRVR